MPNLGPMEILVVLVVALLVLGPTRLPEAGRQVGKALSEVRRWSSGVQEELRDALEVREEYDAPVIPPLETTDTTWPSTAAGEPTSGPRPPSAFPEEQSFS
jgi:sec-independent protein translocase protein TatA